MQADMAAIMGDDEIEEHAEAIELIQSPHKVKITIMCRDLADMDIGGKSDPYAICYLKGEKDKKWYKLGKTETQYEKLDPNFEKQFEINYLFERNQVVRIEVYDEDNDGSDDLIGNFDCPLNKLLIAQNQTIKDDLRTTTERQGTRGRIYIQANSVSESNDVVKMDIVCRILDKKKKDNKGFLCFCRPPEDNPFLVIERQGPQDGDRRNDWIEVHKSEVMEGTLEPQFNKISINRFQLCNNKDNHPLRFSLYSQSDPDSKPLLYGSIELSCAQIESQTRKNKD